MVLFALGMNGPCQGNTQVFYWWQYLKRHNACQNHFAFNNLQFEHYSSSSAENIFSSESIACCYPQPEHSCIVWSIDALTKSLFWTFNLCFTFQRRCPFSSSFCALKMPLDSFWSRQSSSKDFSSSNSAGKPNPPLQNQDSFLSSVCKTLTKSKISLCKQ